MQSHNEADIGEFPPPYQQLTNWAGVEGLFLGAALICALSLAYSILQENREALGLRWLLTETLDLWSIRLLGTAVSASLLSAFLSLYFLRRQFLHSAAPLLDYRSYVTTSSSVGLSCQETEKRVYVVALTNVGKGVCIITGARYWLEFLREDGGPQGATFMNWFRQRARIYGSRKRYRYSYHTVERLLEQNGIRDQQHFDALHFGEWTALSSDETRIILEICLANASAIVALDIEITYRSVVGDRYRREIYAIPRRQLTSAAALLDQARPAPRRGGE